MQHWPSKLAPHVDPDFKSYILSGIQSGFCIGLDYKSYRCSLCTANTPSTEDHRQIIDNYLANEMKNGRVLGPFPKGSIPQVQISHQGVIPKKSNPAKWR